MADQTLIIDIQGYADDSGNLIPKEVAWELLSGTAEMHAIIRPPCSWQQLSSKSRTVNDYLEKNELGIKWCYPGISHDRMAQLATHIPPEIQTDCLHIRLPDAELAQLMETPNGHLSM
uniref:Uncharacterized protein n=1 Tax=Bracon brevicornis TaxID=1563983 RepID=A0A6V7KPH1_9HYME